MPIRYEPVSYGELPEWQLDDAAAALSAFCRSIDRFHPADDIAFAAQEALGAGSQSAARRFFEQVFTPCAVLGNHEPGRVTGYYEPHLKASHHCSPAFPHPIYRRPPDLVNLVDDAMRGSVNGELTHARLTASGAAEPYPERSDIDLGALSGRGLELAWVGDQVDLFFLQVQGSGLLEFEDGSRVRIGYDGKNGYPYSSIGRHLIDAGFFSAAQLTMPVLIAWLRADTERARKVMWINRSYIFFRELPAALEGPLGNDAIPLTPGRSLAVDGSFHPVGTPIYVHVPDLHDPDSGRSFARLMIGQDAGSAINGAERGDIYYGSGYSAGERAGLTNHTARFFILKLSR
ncbi:MAG: hypothetical protein RLZ98_416 [Pseudomonadota bacterium]|jgi:membrane-bound lytic murein transglycosylase A